MNRKEWKAKKRAEQLEREQKSKVQSPTSNGAPRTAEYAEDGKDQKAESGKQKADYDRDTQRCARAMKKRREFYELCKREGIKIRPAGLRNVYGKIAPSQMVWRRITGMTIPIEAFMDALERRAGIERLMNWLEKAARRGPPSPCGRGLGGGVGTARTAEPAQSSDLSHPSPYPLPQGEGENNSGASRLGRQDAGGTPAPTDERLVLSDWSSELGSWQRVKTDGFSIEAICAQLGISRWKLTQLTKEYCNLTANEIIDGYKLKNLKSFLLGRIKDAAFDLWGKPGYFATHKIEGYVSCSEKCPTNGMTIRVGSRKQSKFFRLKPEDLLHEHKWAEKARRTSLLIQKMWEGFDLESWAIAAGYSNASRLKRAVLTVMGKTLGMLEELLAKEIVEYYQCAEDRELRNLACNEKENAEVFRAREFYHGSEDRPTAPFLDQWSAAEAGTPEWLAKMSGAFG